MSVSLLGLGLTCVLHHCFSEPHAKVRHPVPKLSNKQFTKSFFFFKIPDFVHRPTAAAVPTARWPLDGATKSDTALQHFVSAFIFVLIRKPADVYYHTGPKLYFVQFKLLW